MTNTTRGMKPKYVIWDPAPNRIVGQEEDWTRRQAQQFLDEHPDSFSCSAHVTENVWPLVVSP